MGKRICCFCEKWESGGIEACLYQLITHMDLTGLEIDIVACRLCPSVFTKPLEQYGVHFYELSGSLRRPFENRRRFRALVKQRGYELAHLNVYQGMSLAFGRAAKRSGCAKVIAHSHNTALRKSPLRGVKMLLHRFYSRRFTPQIDSLWACSASAAEFLFPKEQLEKRGFTFLANGIDLRRFARSDAVREQVRSELKLNGRFVLGNVGRLCYQKNQEFLLDVLAEVKKQKPQALLLLVGEGPDRAGLEKKCRDRGLSGSVLFFGTTDQPERLYQAMDVFVFPSRFEGLPIAAIEAQAAGLPTLVSEQIPEEARRCVQVLPPDAAAWAEAALSARAEQSADMTPFDIFQTAKTVEKTWKSL